MFVIMAASGSIDAVVVLMLRVLKFECPPSLVWAEIRVSPVPLFS